MSSQVHANGAAVVERRVTPVLVRQWAESPTGPAFDVQGALEAVSRDGDVRWAASLGRLAAYLADMAG